MIMQRLNETTMPSLHEDISIYLEAEVPSSHVNKNSTLEIFKFNLTQAVHILEQYRHSDQVFEGSTRAIILSSYVLLIVAGVFTNLMVSLFIMTNPRLRIARNLFIVNLSISDLLLCLFCMPFTLTELLNREWNLGSFLCRGVPFVQAVTIFVSSATVSAIAIDRQYVITRYSFQKNRREESNMLLYTIILWIFSLVLSLPVIFSKTVTAVRLAGIVLYDKCIEKWPSSYVKAIYTLLILVAQFFIPSIVLTVTHLRIKSHLNYSIRRHTTPGSLKTSERLKKELSRNNRATMMLSFIFVVFATSWLPWNAFNLLADFELIAMRTENFYLTFAVCHLIAMSSSVTNPILYGWLNSNIKRELLQIRFTAVKHALSSGRPSNTENGLFKCDNLGAKSSGGMSTAAIEECNL